MENWQDLLNEYNEALDRYTTLVARWNNDQLGEDDIRWLWNAIQEALETKEAAWKAYEEATA